MEVYAQLLGAPQLRLADDSLEPPLTKATLLLYYLAYKREWCSRDELVYLFYPESSESNARSNLRQRLTSLRRLPYTQDLEIEAARLRWPVETDVHAFRQAVSDGNNAQATKLYRGQLLEGCALPDAPEFEEWLLGEREDLHGQWRDLVFGYGPSLEAAQPEEAANLLRTVLKYDPLDEEALRAFMQAAARAGQKSVALRTYKSFSSHLQDELDLEPTSATQQLAAAIGRGEVSAVERATNPSIASDAREKRRATSLPATTTSFVGRDKEIAQVSELLSQEDCRLLTILAAGGMGKTRLALQVLSSLTHAYPDGCSFVALDAITSPEAVYGAIAASLGTELRGQVEPLVQVTNFVGDKTMLLVFDNFEHLLEAATIISELIQRCPNLKMLVTSRERLNLAEEWLLQLDGLTYPERYTDAEAALATDAVALFIQRAEQVRPDFAPADEDLSHIVSVCGLVEGSPLAIELSAAWVRVMPCSEIADELMRGIDFLTTPTRNIPERHRSLRATFEHSWKLLTPVEQDVLRKLSVFVVGFRREAASVVASAPVAVLAALVDKSLLRATPEGRYDQHSLLRQYTCEKLAEQPEVQEETRRKHSSYFLRFLEGQTDESRRGRQREALRAVDTELPNILEVAQRALEGEQRRELIKVMRLLAVDGPYFMARGYNAQLLNLLEEAANAARETGEVGAAHGLFGRLGDALQNFVGDLNQAVEAYKEAHALARQAGHVNREAVFLSNIGVVQARQGKNEEAHKHLGEAYELTKALADDLCLAAVLEQFGYVVATKGEWQQAQHLFQESLEVLGRLAEARALQQPELDHRHFFALINLSDAERNLKRYEEALDACRAALTIAEACDNQVWIAHVAYNLGDIHHDMGQRTLAEQHFSRALELYQKHEAKAYVEQVMAFMKEQGYRGGKEYGVV